MLNDIALRAVNWFMVCVRVAFAAAALASGEPMGLVFGLGELAAAWLGAMNEMSAVARLTSWRGWLCAVVYLAGGLLVFDIAALDSWGYLVAFVFCCVSYGALVVTRFMQGRAFSVGAPTYVGRVCECGLFRHVRHPGYALAIASHIAMTAAYPSVWNLAACAAFTFGLAFVAIQEERFLWQFGDYRAYVDRVRWRFVPLVW